MKIKSFGLKILGIIFLATFLITAALGVLSFEFSRRRIVSMLGESIKGIAVTTANFINPEDIAAIISAAERKRAKHSPGEERLFPGISGKALDTMAGADYKISSQGIEIYNKYSQLLSSIKAVNRIDGPINAYLKDGRRFKIVLTSDKAVLIGARYGVRPEAQIALSTHSAQSTAVYKDKDGVWISAYAPISADIPVVIEISYKIDSYLKKLHKEMSIILTTCLVVFFGTLLISYRLANRSVSAIRQLNAMATDLERGHYDVVINVRSDDEIGHLSQAFENLRVSIKRKINELRLSLAREKKAHLESVIALINAVGLKDPYIRQHVYRVEKYALLIARAMHIPKDEIERLRYGCYLHDIGKLEVESSLLQKIKLSREDFEQLKRHSENGAKIVEGIQFLDEVRDIILHHQEHYDGTGYPDGLKGEAIPLLARIVAVADAFDAMTTDRPYKTKMSFKEAMDVIRKNSGSQFDSEVCDALLKYKDEIDLIAKRHFKSS